MACETLTILWAFAITAWADRTEPDLVFAGSNERADHAQLPVYVAQRSLIYRVEPEVNTAQVGIAPQVAEILRHYESAVIFRIYRSPVVDRVARRVRRAAQEISILLVHK